MRTRRFWPFRHLGLKVLAVALAVLLWLVVAGEETVERSVRVPLELQQVPIGLDLMSEPPATVDVLVRGASDAIGRMSPGDLVAVLDLRSAREGRRLFPLTPNEVRAPFGVDVVAVTPNTVGMNFEREGTEVLPVAPAVEGIPATGFVIGQIVSNPAKVEVVGPVSALGHVKAAMTEPVVVTNASRSVVEKVTVGIADPYLRLKTPTTASVTVNVIPAPAERTLAGVPVRVRTLAQGFVARVEPASVSVTVRGDREDLRTLEPAAISAFVDADGLRTGRYTLMVRADSQAKAGIVAFDPPDVRVTISRRRSPER